MSFQLLDRFKQLDSYSLLITSKYFVYKQDYLNIICVCKKFKQTTKKLRYNPISVTSLKLFPKIQTQYLYSRQDRFIKGIKHYEIWFDVDYDEFIQMNNNNIKFRCIHYTQKNKGVYGNIVPNNITTLNDDCFIKSNIHSITIPNSVTSIGNNCFEFCLYLTNVVLSNHLIRINDDCFSSCVSLTSVIIPTSVQSLGRCCFDNCSNLQTIIIPDTVTSIGCNCFQNCEVLQTIKLPRRLSILENGTFNVCYKLNNVQLPSKLISIGDNCFNYCLNLSTIHLPSTLKHIGNNCFSSSGLCRIEIPPSVILIGFDCFSSCESLTQFKLLPSLNEDKKFQFKVSFNDAMYYNRHGIKCSNIVLTKNDVKYQQNELFQQQFDNNYNVPNGIIELDSYALSFQKNIKSITIPTTVTTINENCFCFCSSLTLLSIPNDVSSIGKNCYLECYNLTHLSLPLNDKNKYHFKVSYSDYLVLKQCNFHCERIVFSYDDYFKCNKKIPLDIPLILNIDDATTCTSISNNIISLKSNHLSKDITSIIIPSNITYLCNNCFQGYSKLQSITILTTIQYIGKHIIDNCVSLTELQYEGDWDDIIVSYDDHLRYKSIGLIFNSIEYTLNDSKKYGPDIPPIVHSLQCSYYDRSFQIFNILHHITTLDDYMFSSIPNKYSNIQSIVFPTSITTIPKYCFLKCYLLTYISLSTCLTSIKKKAFEKCISLQSITIPKSVILLDKFAFVDCYSLTCLSLLK